jgi:hypothetical protein
MHSWWINHTGNYVPIHINNSTSRGWKFVTNNKDESYLLGPGINLTGANLCGVDCTGVDFTNCNMKYIISLKDSKMIDLKGLPDSSKLPIGYSLKTINNRLCLLGPELDYSNLDLSGTDLNSTNLSGCTFYKTKFGDANLENVNFFDNINYSFSEWKELKYYLTVTMMDSIRSNTSVEDTADNVVGLKSYDAPVSDLEDVTKYSEPIGKNYVVYKNSNVTITKLELREDDILIISESATIYVQSDGVLLNRGTILNYGTINVSDKASLINNNLIHNYGIFEVYGHIKVEKNGKLINRNYFGNYNKLTNFGEITIPNGSTGEMYNGEHSIIMNNGSLPSQNTNSLGSSSVTNNMLNTKQVLHTDLEIDTNYTLTKNTTIYGNLSIPSGKTFTIPAPYELEIYGKLLGEGDLLGDGKLTFFGTTLN